MKKVVKSLWLLSAVALLSACQLNQEKETSLSSTSTSSLVSSSSTVEEASSTSSSTETETSSSTAPVLSEAYQVVVNRYRAGLGQPATALNPDEVSSQLALLTQSQDYSGAVYSLYDIDHDGVEELLVALQGSEEYVLIDLYTQLGDGSLLRLVDNFRTIGFEIGPDALLRPLEDGTYLFEAGGVFRIYQYKPLIPGLKRISESDANPETSPVLDLTSLNWAKL